MTDEQTTEQVPQLGLRLKQAREAKGLTVEEVAERLNLRVVNIEEIEAERFDTQVSTTFTRGYVKQYAKLVDVPEDEAVAALDELNAVKPEPTKLHSFSKKVSKQASDDRLMLLSYAILAVIIGLVVLWWFQQSNEGKTVGSALPDTLLTSEAENSQDEAEPVGETKQVLASDSQPEPKRSQPRPEPVDLTRVEAEQPSVAEPTTTETSVSETTESTADNEPVSETRAQPEPQTPVEDAESEVLSEPVETAPTTEPVSSNEINTTATQSSLENEVADVAATQAPDGPVVDAVFEFSGDCWVNIVDATGEAIAYGIKKAGRTMPVSGVAPFEVTLGAPETVTVSFDGEPVDMSDFRAGRTARFTLPRQ